MEYSVKKWAQIAENYNRGTIVLGNGASIAVSPNFKYSSLLGNVQNGELPEDVSSLFTFFNTDDFELILRLLWQVYNVNRALKISDARTNQAYFNVRESLIKAVRNMHPSHEKVKDRLASMYQFLKSFNTVLSLNYDLLVYWTMTHGLNIKDGHQFKDCFINGKFDENWQRLRTPYLEKTNTLVFYPHGCLALGRDAEENEMKLESNEAGRVMSSASGLLETIFGWWNENWCIPLFVSEGTMAQKITSILSSHYLSTVYLEVLPLKRETLTLYGWGLGEQDRHLLRRMRESGIKRVAVSVYGDDQGYCQHVSQTIQKDLGEVQVDFFDSKSSGCWIY